MIGGYYQSITQTRPVLGFIDNQRIRTPDILFDADFKMEISFKKADSAKSAFLVGGISPNPGNVTAPKIGFLTNNQLFIRVVAGGNSVTKGIGYTAEMDNTWCKVTVERINGAVSVELKGQPAIGYGTMLGTFGTRFIGVDEDNYLVTNNFFTGRLAHVRYTKAGEVVSDYTLREGTGQTVSGGAGVTGQVQKTAVWIRDRGIIL
jgi:hypothetical protein